MASKYANLEERLLANSMISDEGYYQGSFCWMWIGRVVERNGLRYGRLNIWRDGKSVTVRAHRLALLVFKGIELGDDKGLHMCNFSLCINPEHVVGGTQSDNMRQMWMDGRRS